MGKLTPSEVTEYFETHLPYRTRILLAHFKMRHDPVTGKFVAWTGNASWLDAGFVAALITARLYLNVLGIAKDGKGTALVKFKGHDDDITVDDLGGTRVSISSIPIPDQKVLLDFLIMSDKAAAHFTALLPHDRTVIPKVIVMIHGYIKTHLYDVVGRTDLETVVPECL
jgi:hypothetical protein